VGGLTDSVSSAIWVGKECNRNSADLREASGLVMDPVRLLEPSVKLGEWFRVGEAGKQLRTAVIPPEADGQTEQPSPRAAPHMGSASGDQGRWSRAECLATACSVGLI
jgi:hypothetical protein